MSEKKRDKHSRWRSRTVAFRVSDEENRAIDEMVALSGLTKQDYILTRALQRDVVIYGNPRVFKALRSKMDEIINRLNGIKNETDISEELQDTIKIVANIYARMTEKEG